MLSSWQEIEEEYGLQVTPASLENEEECEPQELVAVVYWQQVATAHALEFQQETGSPEQILIHLEATVSQLHFQQEAIAESLEGSWVPYSMQPVAIARSSRGSWVQRSIQPVAIEVSQRLEKSKQEQVQMTQQEAIGVSQSRQEATGPSLE